MLLEMGLIVAGIPAGWLLRRNDKAKALVGRALTWAVWALLFMLGLALGVGFRASGANQPSGSASCRHQHSVRGGLSCLRPPARALVEYGYGGPT